MMKILIYDDSLVVFFFFQAEDGIRDYKVTGVQTCALPICVQPAAGTAGGASRLGPAGQAPGAAGARWARAAGPARLRGAAHRAAPDVRAVRRGAGALPHGAAAALGARVRTSRQLADERLGQGRAVAGSGEHNGGGGSLLRVAAEAPPRRLPLKRHTTPVYGHVPSREFTRALRSQAVGLPFT